MASGSAELNYSRRRSDTYVAPSSRLGGATRPAWQPYESPEPRRNDRRAAQKPLFEEDYHPVIPLKIMTPAEIRAIVLVVLVVTAIAMSIIFLSAQAAVAQ